MLPTRTAVPAAAPADHVDHSTPGGRAILWRQLIFPAVLALACLVPLLTWWRGHQLVWGLDGSFPIRLADVNRYFTLGSTAYASPDARKLSFIVPWGLLLRGWEAVGLPWNAAVAQRVFEVTLLVASAYGCRAFIRKLLPNTGDAAVTIAALFYLANAYVLTTVWTSQSYLIVHYSLLPLLAVLVIRSLESGGALRWAATGLGWTLMMSPAYITTPLVVTDVAALAMLAVWAIAARNVPWRRAVSAGAVILGSWLVLNLYWIVPLARNYSTTFAEGIASISGTQSATLFHLNSAPLLPALRLGGYWGLTGSIHGSPYYAWAAWDTPLVDLVAYLPIALGAVALLTTGTKMAHDSSHQAQRTLAILAVGLVFVLLLVTGSTGPLGPLKLSFFRAAHLLAPFRSVYQRFMEYMPLVVAPLMAAGIDALARTGRLIERPSATGSLVRRSAVWGMGLLAVVLVPLPWWAGSLFDRSGMLPSERVSVPTSYSSLAARIPAGGGSILTLPIGTTNVAYLQWAHGANGFMGIQPLSFMANIPTLDQAPSGSYVRRVLSGGFRAGSICPTLQKLNVNYVAFETDADPALMEAVGGYLGLPLVRTAAALRDAPCLRSFGAGAGLTVYRNVWWRASLVSFAQSPSGPGVPAQYHVRPGDVVTVDAPSRAYRYLLLNEPSDSGWALNGSHPVAGGDITAFRLVPGANLVLANEGTAQMRRLLVLTSVVAAAIAGTSIVVWVMRRRRPVGRSPRVVSSSSGSKGNR